MPKEKDVLGMKGKATTRNVIPVGHEPLSLVSPK